MTVAGFGSLLSETSARSTFPQLRNFRQGRLRGWRRVFAHQVGALRRSGSLPRGTPAQPGSL